LTRKIKGSEAANENLKPVNPQGFAAPSSSMMRIYPTLLARFAAFFCERENCLKTAPKNTKRSIIKPG